MNLTDVQKIQWIIPLYCWTHKTATAILIVIFWPQSVQPLIYWRQLTGEILFRKVERLLTQCADRTGTCICPSDTILWCRVTINISKVTNKAGRFPTNCNSLIFFENLIIFIISPLMHYMRQYFSVMSVSLNAYEIYLRVLFYSEDNPLTVKFPASFNFPAQ